MAKKYRWDEENKTKVGKYLTAKEKLFLDEFFANYRPKKMLDLGCGSGRFSVDLFRKGVEIVGIDNDPLPLAILKKKAPKIKTIRTDGTQNLPFDAGSFDCVISIQFVDYVTDLNKFFKEVNRVLKKNGYFVFTLGNKNSYKKILHIIFGKDRGRYQFSYNDTRSILKKNGLKLIWARGYHWIPFYRSSNNFLTEVFSGLEKLFNLEKLPKNSPWVFYVAKKI